MPTIEVTVKRLEQMPEKLTNLGHIFESYIDRSETLAIHAYFCAPQVELSILARCPITFSCLGDVLLSLLVLRKLLQMLLTRLGEMLEASSLFRIRFRFHDGFAQSDTSTVQNSLAAVEGKFATTTSLRFRGRGLWANQRPIFPSNGAGRQKLYYVAPRWGGELHPADFIARPLQKRVHPA
jgi:hypothetical protein